MIKTTFLMTWSILIGFFAGAAAWAYEMPPVVLTYIGDAVEPRATFQSHNQKVVQNAFGIFMTCAPDPEKGAWSLLCSEDGGTTFRCVFAGTQPTTAPCLETDGHDRLYLAHPDWRDPIDPFYFYCFSPEDRYGHPQIRVIEKVPCDARFSMAYDPKRERFYIATQYGELLIVEGRGAVMTRTRVVAQKGPNGQTQYPHLSIGEDGTIHLALCNVGLESTSLYRGIHYLQSPDGGLTWRSLAGQVVQRDSSPDETGPTTWVSSSRELSLKTWLASCSVFHGKLHFIYRVYDDVPQMHYVRYDTRAGTRDIDFCGRLKGANLEVSSMDGFFVQGRRNIYLVMSTLGKHLTILCSENNGSTWQDYAISEECASIYAPGGCRAVTADGHIVGSFTRQKDDSRFEIWFFRVPAS